MNFIERNLNFIANDTVMITILLFVSILFIILKILNKQKNKDQEKIENIMLIEISLTIISMIIIIWLLIINIFNNNLNTVKSINYINKVITNENIKIHAINQNIDEGYILVFDKNDINILKKLKKKKKEKIKKQICNIIEDKKIYIIEALTLQNKLRKIIREYKNKEEENKKEKEISKIFQELKKCDKLE